MIKIEGVEYLYQHGQRYLVRMQVPALLQGVIGKREMKKSLGGDLVAARRKSHRVIEEFHRIIETARGYEPTRIAPVGQAVTNDQMDRAVYDHFRRMTMKMRGKAVPFDEADPDPSSREGRVRTLTQHIGLMRDTIDRGDFGKEAQQAVWLCEEHGWSIAPESDLFARLCERMVRARLESYKQEMERISLGFVKQDGIDPLFGATPPPVTQRSRSLGDLMDKFDEERRNGWSASTKKNYVIIVRVLEEICGRETPLIDIDRAFCREVRDALLRLPSNYQKKPFTKGRPIPEVIEIAEKHKMPLLKPATVNAHLNKLGAIIRFGRDEGWVLGNPMANIDVNDPVDSHEKRDPFSIEQLQIIFSSEPWSGGREPPDGRPSRFWLPLIALFTGARLGEICGLRLDEFVRRDGYPCIYIKHRQDRPTKGGRSRYIPAHSALVELGLLAFVEEQRDAGATFLFPEEKANSHNHWGDAVSDWFGRRIRHLNLVGTALCVHSFRHAFEDALREADLHDSPLGNALTGRRSGSVSGGYGSGYSTAKLAAAIESVQYRGLSLSHLMLKTSEPPA